MRKNKRSRFKDIKRFDNVFEYTDFQGEDIVTPKGRWGEDIFHNHHPVTLELACGKGAYTLALARRNPLRNYIGIDIKGSRLWKGAKKAREEELENVRFLRIYIDHLEEYFAVDEVDEMWITFPDPYPRGSDRGKRLTSTKFLRIYQTILKKDGVIHFKTDSPALFKFTQASVEKFGCTTLEVVNNIYEERPGDELLTIKTDFEKKHLANSKVIRYLKFTLP